MRRRCDPLGAGAVGLGDKDISWRASWCAGKTRKGDLMRRQTRTSCAPAAAALPPWPQAAAAVLNRQRARHKAASLVRNRPTPSGSPESPRAAGRSPRLQTAWRPGAQRTRSELSAACCRRRAGSAQVSPLILRPVGGTCAAAAACAPDCSGRWSAGQGRGTAAGCACAEVRRAPARGVRRRGRFPARALPDPRPAAPRGPGRRARRARISGCETGPHPQPKSRRAVGSRGPERARRDGNHLAQHVLAGCGAVGAPCGGTSKICAIATLKTSPKIAAATRRGGSAAAASEESGPSACVGWS